MTRSNDLGTSRPSEFRRDPHSGEWVTIARSRQTRPSLPDECPFCVGGLEAPEPYSVKAFTNRWPVMEPAAIARDETASPGLQSALNELRTAPIDWATGASGTSGAGGIYESAPTFGAAEVILYTPEHEGSLGGLPASQLEAVWDLWVERTGELASREEIASVLIFENRGEEVGVTIHHPHCQIYAFPFVPPRQRHELGLLKARSGTGDARSSCITCQLARAETASEADGGSGNKRLVATTPTSIAYVPYASAWPLAAHFVPKRHTGSIAEFTSDESSDMRSLLTRVLTAGDRIFDRPLPTMTAMLQAPCDRSDPDGLWHMRIEVVSPMRKKDVLRYVAAAEVSSATYANPVTPEDAAALWRSALEKGR